MSTNASGSPVLSLLIPIYNVQRYLRECLDSAVAQTLKDIEIICINDGSTDSSPDIIREYMERDARVKMIDKANSGYGDSMNRGLEMARGKYMGILESDDFMAPDALEKLVSAAEDCNADFAKANFDFYWSKPEERRFAFKVIACADKAVYLHDAVLSYRQDNENSSVNSSAKVFCVNAEYAEIERWIREDYARNHASDDVARMLKFNQVIKYDSYMWNYVRLAPEFYKEFLVQITKEFQAALDAGDFSLDDLKPWKRANLAAILKDPEAWVDEHPHFATDGALGRAKYYASVGGPGVVAAFLFESLRG